MEAEDEVITQEGKCTACPPPLWDMIRSRLNCTEVSSEAGKSNLRDCTTDGDAACAKASIAAEGFIVITPVTTQ